jgi:DUF4097 and DUF4098 domain-containing protein YvlB
MQNNEDRSMKCSDSNRDGGHFCDIREQTIGAVSALNIDGGKNGGVSVKGWNRNDILVRSMVQANAATDDEARANAGQIRVSTSGGQIKADGPEFGDRRSWGVSYEIFVPHNTDLTLTAHNGGIAVKDVRGRIEFETTNGGVSLARLAGSVHGRTQNGGLKVEMMGDRWDGTEFDASTMNGGVHLAMPANYNARLETSTVNGHVSIDFPVMVNGKISRDLTTNIGNGGPLVRAKTINGGVKIQTL